MEPVLSEPAFGGRSRADAEEEGETAVADTRVPSVRNRSAERRPLSPPSLNGEVPARSVHPRTAQGDVGVPGFFEAAETDFGASDASVDAHVGVAQVE